MEGLRPKFTFANVVATLALFIALGGASYAALKLPKNSVGAKQLKKNAVTEAKIKNESVSAAKVKKGTLTGAQINASTLGLVPGAAHATSADQATNASQATSAANGAVRIDFVSATGSDPAPSSVSEPAAHEIFNRDGMNLRASCIDAGAEGVRIYTSIGSSVRATFQWTSARFTNPGNETGGTGTGLNPGKSFGLTDLTGGNQHETGELIYRNATNTISVLFRAGAEALEDGCEFVGTATSAG
jgi:hypothetical protein